MPPKNRFTKDEIVKTAVDIVRENGINDLTARSLAVKLGCSVKPIFGLFSNMEQLRTEVMSSAQKIYKSYLKNDMTAGKYPEYKASGMAYIRFAKEEKQLFRLLFMRSRPKEQLEDGRDDIKPLIELIQKNTGLNEDEAYLFHLEMWIYVHGIAAMIATDYLDWDIEFISQTLTDVYTGLKHSYKIKGEQK